MEYRGAVELYDRLVSNFAKVKRKGKTMPYTSLNGHMFSFLGKDGAMGLRLSKTDMEVFHKEYNDKPMMQYGSVMREYVIISEDLLNNTEILIKWFEKSFKYVKTLKPKPTK